MARRLIVHPSDFSAAARPAFAAAIEMAQATRSTLVLMHVLNPAMPPVLGDEYISPPTYAQFLQVSRTWARRQLDRLTARARASRVRAVSIIREGAEADQIVRLARSRRASMIVMGTHGRTGVGRVILGSVAARVLSLAPCPVLTVRGR
jgi:nucleotide-binding universal stress UspA family protein